MNERVARIEAILPTLATKADIAEVRSDIKGWMLATVLTIVATMVASVIGFSTLFRPGSQAPTAQPIIIQLPSQPAPAQAPVPTPAPVPAPSK